jgi:fructose-specific phosphotransferase system IIC component
LYVKSSELGRSSRMAYERWTPRGRVARALDAALPPMLVCAAGILLAGVALAVPELAGHGRVFVAVVVTAGIWSALLCLAIGVRMEITLWREAV